jgi:hypothetical protein
MRATSARRPSMRSAVRRADQEYWSRSLSCLLTQTIAHTCADIVVYPIVRADVRFASEFPRKMRALPR